MTSRSNPPAVAQAIAAPDDDLCLSFANTLSWRGSAAPAETLGRLPDLLTWLAGSGPQRSPARDRAADWALANPRRAARVFAEAIMLREAIFRCCLALASGDAVAEADLDTLNRALATAPPRRRLVRDHGGYAWAAGSVLPSVALLLAPVLWSAADLIARANQLRVRCCANDKCLWLFIDRSKAGTRRWCDMAACGNRAKAQRHYRNNRPT